MLQPDTEVGRQEVRTSAPAEPLKRRSYRNAGPQAPPPPPPPPPRVSFRPSSSGAAGQLEPLSQGAYWDPPGSRRGEAVSHAGPDCHPLGRGTRAASASSGTASSSKNMEDTPAGPHREVSDDLGREILVKNETCRCAARTCTCTCTYHAIV